MTVSTGIITTIAGETGTGSYGYSGDGGLAIYALLARPISVSLDLSGSQQTLPSTNSHPN